MELLSGIASTILASLQGNLGAWVAFVLTLMVFSYLLGDNPFFRLAEYLFVGTVAGYVVVVAYHEVLKPRLVAPLIEAPGDNAHLLLPLLLGLLLMGKGKRSTAWMGNVTMGFLFGVGGALAIAGAMLGTLGPQIGATWVSLNPAHYDSSGAMVVVNGALIILGTIGTLLYFYYREPAESRTGGVITFTRKAWGKIGYWFILIALGAIFGNTVLARFSLLVERMRFLLDMIGLPGG